MEMAIAIKLLINYEYIVGKEHELKHRDVRKLICCNFMV